MNTTFRASLLAIGMLAGAGPPQFLPVSARWCLPSAPAAPQARPRCIELEVADTPRRQSWGMQLRPPLPPLRGMWFPYPVPTPARFWMHHTPEPLDMLFVRNGRVVHIQANAAPCPQLPCPSYGSDEPVDGVVELAGGQAAALDLRVGSPVRIEAIAPAGAAIRPAPQP
jgi:uncharacterized membrane protein (UPF0127 family)